MNRIFTFVLLAATAFAAPARAEETAPAVSTTLTLSYDSRYVLYGYRLSRHLFHGDVYLAYPLDEQTTVWGGGWYGYLTDGTYNELDIYGGIDRMLNEFLTVGFQYSLFNYLEVPFETSDQVHEFAVHGTVAFDAFSFSLRDQYDTEAEGHLVRGIAGYTQAATDALSISLECEAGYALEYFIEGNRWNHALVTLETPYAFNASTAITPFVSRSIPLAAIDDFEQYETVFGASVSVSF